MSTGRAGRIWVALVCAGLAAHAAAPSAPASFPGTFNGKIAFDNSPFGDQDVALINADRSGRNPLTATGAEIDFVAEFSPTGGQIVFASDRAGSLDVWRMNANGSAPANLTPAAASVDIDSERP